MSQKKEMLYEGKAKQVFATENPAEVVVRYKDDATAFNNQKKGQVDKKGELNNEISTLIFEYLNDKGIPTHFISKLNDREQLVKKVDIIPIEVIVRNYVAGSMAQRLGLEEGMKSPVTIFDICYKKDELGDPLINDHHAVCLGAATYDELKEMYALTGQINELLGELFDKMNIILVDFKIELGKTMDGKIVLADEISPDTCRLWDKDTMKKLDKDRFRRDLGEVTEAYEEIYNRLKTALNK
ncbi:phosphoribosylaminoimidazolesuccinocarboxamide synthase [Elizabethkingia ursingii]|uniref:phosphoribosylaminoimidazolesuccinocarboxamide synthase n=1 Tax=Elizabethkingia ursingii TaxID=1756150 RepID=UPI002010CCBF|nr:phosphoribosylaminoimidazolesuccinocarboxamide synthase [Elizabethkingia ursingii]MCL1668720.1 phosphoribosylaminoimidazolesuccinocarboxamide synthase [Elizabethkingia ursingii]